MATMSYYNCQSCGQTSELHPGIPELLNGHVCFHVGTALYSPEFKLITPISVGLTAVRASTRPKTSLQTCSRRA
jgi:hypothetical protein